MDPYPGPGDLPLGRQPERQHRLLVILGMPVHPAAHPPPIILVGHSYGGAVITNAATGDSRVKDLVYVDAYAPAQGQIIGQPYPGAPADADHAISPAELLAMAQQVHARMTMAPGARTCP